MTDGDHCPRPSHSRLMRVVAAVAVIVVPVPVIIITVAVMRDTDRRPDDVVANIQGHRFPEVPPRAFGRVACRDAAGQSAKDEQHKEAGDRLQHHKLGQLKAENRRQVKVLPKREVKVRRVAHMVENVVFAGSRHGCSDSPLRLAAGICVAGQHEHRFDAQQHDVEGQQPDDKFT